MKYLSILLLILLLSCNANTSSEKEMVLLERENELLRKELELEKRTSEIETIEHEPQKTIAKKVTQVKVSSVNSDLNPEQLHSKIQNVKRLLKSVYAETVDIDELGYTKIDMGSGSAGRIELFLNEVKLELKVRPEEPGCGDICPPRAIIIFSCITGKCSSDPALPELGKFDSGLIVIDNVDLGKEVFNELKLIQKNI
ncbi:hypothetical protein WG947_05420 [Pontibacter sp. H259]|uniref:hypothetical protein n=1 Tax=Pontibacter sp. H259 TaxID=3133421 RepID=UPI0030C53A11